MASRVKYREYRLHDYVPYFFEMPESLMALSLDKLTSLRDRYVPISPEASEAERQYVSLLNVIVSTKRLLAKNKNCFSSGYRKNREKRDTVSVINYDSYILFLYYRPNGQCEATSYDKDSQLAELLLNHIQLDFNTVYTDDSLLESIRAADYSPSYIKLPLC